MRRGFRSELVPLSYPFMNNNIIYIKFLYMMANFIIFCNDNLCMFHKTYEACVEMMLLHMGTRPNTPVSAQELGVNINRG